MSKDIPEVVRNQFKRLRYVTSQGNHCHNIIISDPKDQVEILRFTDTDEYVIKHQGNVYRERDLDDS